MKRTKIETILIFGILILYYALSQIFFVKMGSIYSIIINPLFWILLCVSLKLYIKKTYACCNLITTISKERIFPPINEYDIIGKARCSNEILNDIDKEIKKNFTLTIPQK